MRKVTRKLITIIGGIIAGVLLIAAACQADKSTGITPTPASPISEVPSGPVTTVSDGTYEVGVDMVAGTYKANCPAWGYWARLRSNSGRLEDIISNNTVPNGGPMIFTAKDGEYVEIRNCTFTKTP